MIEVAEKEKHRAEIFNALGHPVRIAILKALREAPMGFADLKKAMNIDSSGHFKHHLDKLDSLIKTDKDGKYCLSDQGKDALLNMRSIEKYNEDARFQDQVGLLIRALRSDLESVQELAIVQLSLFGSRAIPYLASALSKAFEETSERTDSIRSRDFYSADNRSDPERAVSGIIKVLGIIGDPVAIVDVAKALPRPEAVTALAKIGNNKALEAVIRSIPKWYSKYADEPRYGYYRHISFDEFVRKIFGYFGEEGKKALETALHEGTKENKDIVAKILAVIGDSNSIPALIEALESGEVSTKTEAARALHRLKASEAVPQMVSELFKTQDRAASDALAEAVLDLGSLDDWMLVSFHRPKIDRWNRDFDAAIINSGEKAVPGLTKLLQDPDSSVQRAAAEMIAKIKRGEKDDSGSHYY